MMDNIVKEPLWFSEWKKNAGEQAALLPEVLSSAGEVKSTMRVPTNYAGRAPEYRVVSIEKELELYTLKEALETLGIADLLEGLLTSTLLPEAKTKREAVLRGHIASGLVCYAQPKIDEGGNFVEQNISLETVLPEAGASDILVVIAKTGARINLAHEFSGGGGGSVLERAMIILAEEGAGVNVIDAADHVKGNLYVQRFGLIGSNAHVYTTECISAPIMYQSKSTQIITGSGTTAGIVHALLAGNSAEYVLDAIMDIRAEDAQTKIVAVGAAGEGGHIVYRGNTHSSKTGSGAAVEEAKFLLLDDSAHIEALPMMRAEGNAIEIAHKLTISHISEEETFYAASRGVQKGDARVLAGVSFFEGIKISEIFLERLHRMLKS